MTPAHSLDYTRRKNNAAVRVALTPEGTSVSNTPKHDKSKEGEADRWRAGNVVLCVEEVDLACYIKYACDICISGLSQMPTRSRAGLIV